MNIITIDGHAGAGKGTVAKRVAQILGLQPLDTGMYYRILAFVSKDGTVDFSRITIENRTLLVDGDHIQQEMIRTHEIGKIASQIAKEPHVRKKVTELIHATIPTEGLVADGRDTGTALFPKARHKFFLTASAEVRARRILDDTNRPQTHTDLEALLQEVRERDHHDETREHSPLIQAEDAIKIDSTDLSIEEVVEIITGHWHARLRKN